VKNGERCRASNEWNPLCPAPPKSTRRASVRRTGPGLGPGNVSTALAGSNPAPSASILLPDINLYDALLLMPARKRPEKQGPTPPGEDVVEKLDPDHTDEDFFNDLEKAAADQARKKLGLPSVPDRGSARK
jgi:hypothetical protein